MVAEHPPRKIHNFRSEKRKFVFSSEEKREKPVSRASVGGKDTRYISLRTEAILILEAITK